MYFRLRKLSQGICKSALEIICNAEEFVVLNFTEKGRDRSTYMRDAARENEYSPFLLG